MAEATHDHDPSSGARRRRAAGRWIEPIEIQEEMERSFLEYSMSVIVSRALPDVRDGLKPVHRRILYAMWDTGLRPDRPHVKCAKVVGDVMGRFHPHGDTAIYDALARMVQDFSLRHPLIDGHGEVRRAGPERRPGGDALHGVPARAARDEPARGNRRGHRRLRPELRRLRRRSRSSCRRASRTCSSTARRASPSGWRRTSRRTTSARSSTRRCT